MNKAQIGEAVDDMVNGRIEQGALNGRTVDIVHAIINLDGDEATDEQVLWMLHDVINHWSELADEGVN